MRFATDDLEACLQPMTSASTRVTLTASHFSQQSRRKELLSRHHLAFDPAMHDEGYAIVPDGHGGLIVDGRDLCWFLLRRADREAADSRIGQRYRAARPTIARLAGDGASRALRRLVARAAAQHGLPEARNPHPGGVQVQHFLALLRAHVRLRQHAGCGVSRRRDDAGRSARNGRLRREVSHHRHSRAGVVRASASRAQVRAVFAGWARRRTARCWRRAIPARCR